ncbi:MAG: hypothetical protein HGA62_04765 [Chlorobiaceae bacterium]|nr:hypothetical protein [Chlorobiaceae bacterium]NTV60498.1 hypothetical protein [Chlorobiaceae bacterium]
MSFHESMVIPSLYTEEEQRIIERWIQKAFSCHETDGVIDSNRVAEIALATAQTRLPKGIVISEDGSVSVGRKTWELSVPMRAGLIFPVHVFDIDWDDTHAGMSWPEVYYVTSLPGYHVCVVTISMHSGESYGYSDLSIGGFFNDDDSQKAEKTAGVIRTWWKHLHEKQRKPVWKAIMNTGLIDAETACRLREDEWNKVGSHDEVVP